MAGGDGAQEPRAFNSGSEVGFHFAGNEELLKTFENESKTISTGTCKSEPSFMEYEFQKEEWVTGNQSDGRGN